MPLDPNIILQAGNYPKMDVGSILQLRQLLQDRRVAAQNQAADRDRQAQARVAAGNVIQAQLGQRPLSSLAGGPSAPPPGPSAAMPLNAVGQPAPVQQPAPASPAAPLPSQAAVAPSGPQPDVQDPTQPPAPNSSPASLDAGHQAVQEVGAAAMAGQSTPADAWAKLYALDPEIGDKMVTAVKNLDGMRLAKIEEANQALGTAAFNLLQQFPGQDQTEQRRAAAMALAPQLAQHGIQPQQIANADYSVAGLQGIVGQAQGLAGAIEQHNKDRDFAQKQTQEAGQLAVQQGTLAETTRHDKAEEQKPIQSQFGANLVRPDGTVVYDGSGGGNSARVMGWTPVGNENSRASVDGKIGLIAGKAGVGADAPLTKDQFLALDMTQGEGGAAAPNNPGNMRGSKGGFQSFPNAQAYNGAQKSWLERRWNEGARSIRDAVEGRLVGGTAGGGVGVGADGQIQGAGGMTAEAIRAAAEWGVAHGDVPPAGFARNKAAQAAFQNAMVVIRHEQGLSVGDSIAGGAANKADTASLAALERQATIVRAAEGAAQKNAQLAIQLGRAAPRGNVPIFNAWKNAAGHHTGDPSIDKFSASIETFVNEFASVMGKGTPTDSLRAHGHEMLNAAQNQQQFEGTVGVMLKDMANRSAAYTDERNATLARIGGGTRVQGTLSANVPTFTPEQARNAPKGTRFKTTDGRLMVRQ